MRWTRTARPAITAAVGLAILNCGTDPNAPAPDPSPIATTLAIVSGDAQVGAVGLRLPGPLVVRVTDQSGVPMEGVDVAFVVSAGDGRVQPQAAVTNPAGLAATTWTLGAEAWSGRQEVAASIGGSDGDIVAFAATAIAFIEKASGDHQTAEVASELPQDLTVIVHDATTEPVPGVTVKWHVTSGGGAVSAVESITDDSGATSVRWTLGATVGDRVQELEASYAPGITARFTATGNLTAGKISITAGAVQSGVTGWRAPVGPTALVTTGGDDPRPVAGVRVEWTVRSGGGWVNNIQHQAISDYTDDRGESSVDWTLGASLGANSQTLEAAVAGLDGSPVVFVASVSREPASIVKVSGDLQTGVVGTALAEPLVLAVLDASGAPVAGIPIDWQVWYSVGDGLGTTSYEHTTTDANGLSSITASFGRVAGPAALWISATWNTWTGPWADFTASAVAGPAATIARLAGNAQTSVAGTPLPLPITVIVHDAFGNVKAGTTVNWGAGPGSGSTSPISSLTDEFGRASTAWTLGTTLGAGNQHATATVSGLVGSPVSFAATATPGP